MINNDLWPLYFFKGNFSRKIIEARYGPFSTLFVVIFEQAVAQCEFIV